MALLGVLVCAANWTVEKEPHVERCLVCWTLVGLVDGTSLTCCSDERCQVHLLHALGELCEGLQGLCRGMFLALFAGHPENGRQAADDWPSRSSPSLVRLFFAGPRT